MRMHAGARHAALALLVTVQLLPIPTRADRLLWLAPSRAPEGRLEVGLTLVDPAGVARRPAGAEVKAAGGTLTERAPSGSVRRFEARALRGALQLTARAAGLEPAQATVGIGAPAARVRVAAEPATPVKNQDEAATLTIEIVGGEGAGEHAEPAPVLRANVGSIEGVRPAGTGRFTARYVLPKARYPEVAILVAFAPWPHADAIDGAFGALALPLASKVTLPGKTEPNIDIALEIAGTVFGPVQADAKGRFELPIVVPPGHRFGQTIATDRAGNRRKKQIDLHLPPTDRLACVANPSALPADGAARAQVLCVATDPYGAPLAQARILGRARAGTLSEPRPFGDAYAWTYTAPAALPAADRDELVFDFPAGGRQSRESLPIVLQHPAPASARVEVEPQPLFVGATGAVRLKVLDPAGRPTPARPELRAQRGSLAAFEERAIGEYGARYQPPSTPGDWTDRLAGAVWPPAGEVPARILATREGDALLARVESLGGRPVEGLAVQLDGARATTGRGGALRFALPAAKEPVRALSLSVADRPSVRADLWILRTAEGTQLFPDAGSLAPLRLETPVALAPPTPVDLRVELLAPDRQSPGALRYRVLDLEGRLQRDRAVRYQVTTADGREIATGEPVTEADGAVRVPLRERVSGGVVASVTDGATGVSAAQEATWP